MNAVYSSFFHIKRWTIRFSPASMQPMENGVKYGVLFVCTGNICRSPTAEGAFRQAVRAAGVAERFTVDSAGTHGYHIGEPPDPRAVAAALAAGIDIRDLRARRVTRTDFQDFDLIVAMDRSHFGALETMRAAEDRATLALFMDYVPDGGRRDVPDPYYGGPEDFARVLDLAQAGVRGILDALALSGRTP